MNDSASESNSPTMPSKQPLTCGIIMPISALDGCTADHWSDVKSIIVEAIDNIAVPKFSARLVSEADDVGVIQKRIIQGVYSSEIVVCDVSGKNANVMFELGLRLAFDKPTIIIKDDKTDYSFDTSVIEHLTYPRDLRFSRIVAFKKLLADKVIATYSSAQTNPGHTTFLKNFGTFKVAHLEEKEAPGEQVMLELLADIQRELSVIRRGQSRSRTVGPGVAPIVAAITELKLTDPNLKLEPTDDLVQRILEFKNVARNYPTKESFMEALAQACLVVESL